MVGGGGRIYSIFVQNGEFDENLEGIAAFRLTEN